MTEPVDVLILNALMVQLTSPALSGNPPIASPLVAYTPTPLVAYLDAHPVLRAEPDDPTMAFDGYVALRGIFQVDAVVPDGQGEAVGLRLASLVAARFSQGIKLLAGTTNLLIPKNPAIAAAVKDAPWVRFPVSIPYLIIV